MKNANIKILTMPSNGIPIEYESQFLEIEKDTFGTVYSMCPTNISDVRNRYNGRDLFIIMCFKGEEIVGHRIFERINDIHIQSMFMVVKPPYRGLKLSNIICSFAYQYFKWSGYKYITSWTHINITASKILEKYAPYISTDQELTEKEIELLNAFEISQNKPIGYYGKNRRVKDFYKMVKDESGDAYFWTHIL